ncbi:MAG: DUF488 domain-containing protein [Bauldia sp.]|nr:DUF488 domain-containing protein [Bauldia sp.]
MSGSIQTKRIYEPAAPGDGARVLVDRIWPRGIRREEAKLDLWLKDAAPSTELRKWFGHEPEKWAEFRKRYARELDAKPETLSALDPLLAEGPVTLLFAAKDVERNNAEALRAYLTSHRRR